ncbi:MAG: hypothetical protein HN441_06835 [Candidatus Thioglobus sp.]|jgi:hypothetical protein|nr:hypothetical protein [Candidatus Thioglobus sp.]
MRAGEYLAMAMLAGVGGIVVFALKKFGFNIKKITTAKLMLIYFLSFVSYVYGGKLADGAYSIFGNFLLIAGILGFTFTAAIFFYRIFSGELFSKK